MSENSLKNKLKKIITNQLSIYFIKILKFKTILKNKNYST